MEQLLVAVRELVEQMQPQLIATSSPSPPLALAPTSLLSLIFHFLKDTECYHHFSAFNHNDVVGVGVVGVDGGVVVVIVGVVGVAGADGVVGGGVWRWWR